MPTRSSRVATRWMKSEVAEAAPATRLSTVMSVPPCCLSERVPGGVVFLAESPDREAESLSACHVGRGGDRGRVAVPDLVAGAGRVGVGEAHLLRSRVASGLGARAREQRLDVVEAQGGRRVRGPAAGRPVE